MNAIDANDLNLDGDLSDLLASANTARRIATVTVTEVEADEATTAYEEAGLDLSPAAKTAWITAARGWLTGSVDFTAASKAMDAATRGLVACPRCYGTGRLQHFKHVANGECFACYGGGYVAI